LALAVAEQAAEKGLLECLHCENIPHGLKPTLILLRLRQD
jgi:hypothetical protein